LRVFARPSMKASQLTRCSRCTKTPQIAALAFNQRSRSLVSPPSDRRSVCFVGGRNLNVAFRLRERFVPRQALASHLFDQFAQLLRHFRDPVVRDDFEFRSVFVGAGDGRVAFPLAVVRLVAQPEELVARCQKYFSQSLEFEAAQNSLASHCDHVITGETTLNAKRFHKTVMRNKCAWFGCLLRKQINSSRSQGSIVLIFLHRASSGQRLS